MRRRCGWHDEPAAGCDGDRQPAVADAGGVLAGLCGAVVAVAADAGRWTRASGGGRRWNSTGTSRACESGQIFSKRFGKNFREFLVAGAKRREQDHDDPLVRHGAVVDSGPAAADRGGPSGHGLEPHGREGAGEVGDLTQDIRAFSLEALGAALKPGDIAVSMLPADQHVGIARLCLEKGANFCFLQSYIAPEMRALDEAFREAGLVSINEVGLDPGIDHLMAHDLVARYRASKAYHADNVLSPSPAIAAGCRRSRTPSATSSAGLRRGC
jgi:hypothetical protein